MYVLGRLDVFTGLNHTDLCLSSLITSHSVYLIWFSLNASPHTVAVNKFWFLIPFSSCPLPFPSSTLSQHYPPPVCILESGTRGSQVNNESLRKTGLTEEFQSQEPSLLQPLFNVIPLSNLAQSMRDLSQWPCISPRPGWATNCRTVCCQCSLSADSPVWWIRPAEGQRGGFRPDSHLWCLGGPVGLWFCKDSSDSTASGSHSPQMCLVTLEGLLTQNFQNCFTSKTESPVSTK